MTGHLPYGARLARARTKAQQAKLSYISARNYDQNIPPWVDQTLKRAVHLDPYKRYEALSEFLHDLRHPKEDYLRLSPVPLLEGYPLLFWKLLSLLLSCIILMMLFLRSRQAQDAPSGQIDHYRHGNLFATLFFGPEWRSIVQSSIDGGPLRRRSRAR